MLTLLAPHFLIKIAKKEQKERKSKIGSIFIPETHTYMGREMQSGEIVSISKEAHEDFPEAKIGDILLTHHFTSGKVSERSDDGTHLIYDDENYNYYAVTSRSYGGRGNECYGIYDPKTKEIVPHPDFIFLETDKKELPSSYDDFINQSTTTTTSGLVIFKEWKESRESVTEKNKRLKQRVESLSNIGGGITDELKSEIHKLEVEMEGNTKKSNKKRYEPYVVAASNPAVDEWFNWKVKKGDTVYCLNIASQTTIEFMKVEYRVVKIQYIAFPKEFLRKALMKYNSKTTCSLQTA